MYIHRQVQLVMQTFEGNNTIKEQGGTILKKLAGA